MDTGSPSWSSSSESAGFVAITKSVQIRHMAHIYRVFQEESAMQQGERSFG